MTARWRVERRGDFWFAWDPSDISVGNLCCLFPLNEWSTAVRYADHHARIPA